MQQSNPSPFQSVPPTSVAGFVATFRTVAFALLVDRALSA